MDPALSSQAAAMATEFAYCPRTPRTYTTDTRDENQRVRIEEPAASSLHSSARKSVEGLSSPTRKKSRFFDTLRLKSPRKENTAHENGSPKSPKKRKSITDFLSFSSTKSQRDPEGDHVHPGSRDKTAETASPPKKKVLQSSSPSRMNRRKSLGDIWGSISSRVSHKRDSTVNGRSSHWFDDDYDLSANLGGANDPTSATMSGALGQAMDPILVPIDGQSDNGTSKQHLNRDSGVDVDTYRPQSFRKPSVSSSMLYYEESPRTSVTKPRDEQRATDSSTPTGKGKQRAVDTSTPINRIEVKTPDSYLNLLIVASDEQRAIDSSTPIRKDKQRVVDFLTPINRNEAKTPDSYLNLLIAAIDEHTTPDSYLRELLKASGVSNSAPASPCPRRNLILGEQVLFGGTGDSPQIEDLEDSENGKELSAPPPYDALYDMSEIELAEVTFRQNHPLQSSERGGSRYGLPMVTVREVNPLEEYGDESPNIDNESRLRGGDCKERYEKTMAKIQRSQRSSDESIEKRVELTVAKMTKNFHMITSSEESWEDTSSTTIGQNDFETDQVEVWDSIIIGSRTLQEVCDLNNSQNLTSEAHQNKAKLTQPLKTIPSSERLRHHPVEKSLEESTKLRKLSEEDLIEGVRDGARLGLEASTSNSDQKQISHQISSRKRHNSSTMVRVEFPKTMNLAAHAELFESKSKAIAALYEYKLGELSNFCTYDPASDTIFAHALESNVPNPAILREAGLEVLWLPMQREISQMIQFKEKTQVKIESFGNRKMSPIAAERETTLETEREHIETEREHIETDNSAPPLTPATLLIHNEGIVAANLVNFDHRESQAETEPESTNPRSPSSSLELNPASPQHEQESSILDDDFFLEVDRDVARSYLGSQYSEETRSSYTSDNYVLPTDLLGADSPNELLWNLDDELQDAKPMKTWVELAREYLAENPAPNAQAPESEHPTRTVQSSEEDVNLDARSVKTWSELVREFLTEDSAHTVQEFEYDNEPTCGDYKSPGPFGEEFFSGRSSPVYPLTDYAEDMIAHKKEHSLKGRFSRRQRLSSILADEVSLKHPKRNHLSRERTRPRRRRGLPSKDLLVMHVTTNDAPLLDSSKVLEASNMNDCSAPEVPRIPFPSKEVLAESSRQSSLSFTSYIEAERARERLYQTYPFLPHQNVETKAEKNISNQGCLKLGAILESEVSFSDWIHAEATMGTVTRQLDDQDAQEPLKETGFKRQESEISSTSAIPLPTGFKFSNHRREMTKSEDSENSAISRSSSDSFSKPIAGEEKSAPASDHDTKMVEYLRSIMAVEQDHSEDFARLPASNEDLETVESIGAFDAVKKDLREGFACIPTSNGDSTNSKGTGAYLERLEMKGRGGYGEHPSKETAELEARVPHGTFNEGLNETRDVSQKAQMEGKADCDKPTSEQGGDSDTSLFRRSLCQPQNLSWKAQVEDLNIRIVGKAARQASTAKQEGKVGALVDIFQARGLMPSIKPALYRKESPLRNKSGDRPTTPTARLVTPSGSIYHPAGTVCVSAGGPLSKVPIKRVPTPVSPFLRSSSSFSSVNTDVSDLFGEQLERAEKHSVEHSEDGGVALYEEI